MSWKSTAFVSGAGLLATWLASYSPGGAPVATAPAPAVTHDAASDIQREAERLESKVRAEIEFAAPSRNLFRFGASPVAPAPRVAAPVDAPIVVAEPPAVVVRLSGVAIDTVDGREERIAILNTATGLVFAKEGDEVAGAYRVQKITLDAVDLIRGDGSILQLR